MTSQQPPVREHEPGRWLVLPFVAVPFLIIKLAEWSFTAIRTGQPLGATILDALHSLVYLPGIVLGFLLFLAPTAVIIVIVVGLTAIWEQIAGVHQSRKDDTSN